MSEFVFFCTYSRPRYQVSVYTTIGPLVLFLQNSLTAVEHVKLEASAAEEQNLLYVQSDLRIEVVELTRLAAIKVQKNKMICFKLHCY